MVIMEVMGPKFLDIMLVIAHINQYISASLLHNLYINGYSVENPRCLYALHWAIGALPL